MLSLQGTLLHRQTSLQDELAKARCNVAGSKAVIAVVQAQVVRTPVCLQGVHPSWILAITAHKLCNTHQNCSTVICYASCNMLCFSVLVNHAVTLIICTFGILQQANLQREHQENTSFTAELLHKWDLITTFQERNAAVDTLIKLLFKENMINKQRWEAAAADTRSFLSDQLVPAMEQVSKEACIMHNWMTKEQAAFSQVALHQLPAHSAHGEPFAIMRQSLMHTKNTSEPARCSANLH